MRPKPRQDLARKLALIASVGLLVERKKVLIEVLALHGHTAGVQREQRWLALYAEWQRELERDCLDAADEELDRYFYRLKGRVPFLPLDLNEEIVDAGAHPSGGKTLVGFLKSMFSAEGSDAPGRTGR